MGVIAHCPNCGTILAGEGIASESRQEPAGCAKDSVTLPAAPSPAEQLRGAVEAALDKAETETRRLLDEDDAPMVRNADLDALARVRRLLGGQ